jgi:hypothetical protein
MTRNSIQRTIREFDKYGTCNECQHHPKAVHQPNGLSLVDKSQAISNVLVEPVSVYKNSCPYL